MSERVRESFGNNLMLGAKVERKHFNISVSIKEGLGEKTQKDAREENKTDAVVPGYRNKFVMRGEPAKIKGNG